MKKNAASVTPLGGALWKGGASTFIKKGTNNRWKGVLTDAQVESYEKIARKKLGKVAADWLAKGSKLPHSKQKIIPCVPM